jgi:hypothetical protein
MVGAGEKERITPRIFLYEKVSLKKVQIELQ